MRATQSIVCTAVVRRPKRTLSVAGALTFHQQHNNQYNSGRGALAVVASSSLAVAIGLATAWTTSHGNHKSYLEQAFADLKCQNIFINGTNAAGIIFTAAPVTDFSPFTLASASSLNPLPVTLLSFTAAKNQVKRLKERAVGFTRTVDGQGRNPQNKGKFRTAEYTHVINDGIFAKITTFFLGE